MSLAHDAANDWQEIINDDDVGAGWDCTITRPDGVSQSFVGRMQDIGQQIDPGTEMVVSGRQVGFSVSLADLNTVGFDGIRGIERESEKPWKLTTENILGVEQTYKVAETAPDASLGNMLIYLEPIE